MVRFERALQIACVLSLLDSTTLAFSTTRPFQSSSHGFQSAKSGDHTGWKSRRSRRPENGLALTSGQPRGLVLDDEPKGKESPSVLGQKTVESVFGDGADSGQDMIFVNLESAASVSEPGVVSKGFEQKSEVSLPNDLPKTVFTYTRNDTETKSVTELGQEISQMVITENVGAVLAASEDAMKELGSSFASNGTETASTVSTSLKDLVDIVPVVEVVGEAVTKTDIEAPPVMKILKFAIPAVGVWLCSPLLSLIDTSAVGMLSGTVHQAALNPAVAVTDYAALLIAFLYTATTNIVASAQESDRTLPGKPKTTSSMIGAMQLATYVGAGLGAALFIFARPLLRSIIGNDAINPAVFAAAMKYVRIRALGMPAAAIIGSAQAGCLGCKDIRSPLYVLLAAAVVNFFGDMLFVGCQHPLLGGAAGAAWATVFSQYAALAIFVRWLVKKPVGGTTPKVVDLTKNITDFMGMGKSSSGNKGNSRRNKLKDLLQSNKVNLQEKKELEKKPTKSRIGGFLNRLQKKKAAGGVKPKHEAESVRGLLEGKFRGRDLLKLPSAIVAKEFAPYVAPVTVTQIGRVSGYVAMSHVVSSSLGTISMAAQQVIVSFFYCLTPIADSLSLTAQSFIPGISDRPASRMRADALRKTGRNFLKAGGVFGAVMAVAIGLLPIMSGFFTADPAVVSLVNSVVPLLAAFFAVHGVLCAAEGVLLGQKDLGFLGKMYGTYFFAVPFFMLRVKRAALSGVQGINLSTVWTVFLGYQMVRLLAWVARVGVIQRRTDRAAAALHDSL